MTKRNKIMTLFFAIVLVALAVPGATAQTDESLCSDTPVLNKNCTFVTPTILGSACTIFDYDIVYKNGTAVLTNQPLESIGSDLYRFNFTLVTEQQDYIIQLCEGTTREVRVGGEIDKMTLGFIIILPIIFAGLLMYIANSMNPEEHMLLRFIFGLFSVLMVLPSIWFALIIQQNVLGSNPLDSALSTFLWVTIIVIVSTFFYLFGYMLFKWFMNWDNSKKARLEY